MSASLGIIGCGKMGFALVKGITRDSNLYEKIYASDPDVQRLGLFADEFGALPTKTDDLITKADVVIMAVKPALVREVLAGTHNLWDEHKLLISIAAGVKTSSIEAWLGTNIPVVRVMPNTPCLVGQGACAICAGDFATTDHINTVLDLTNQLGISVVISETYMDAVTAVSGSGPAYVFLLIEALIDAALNMGLSSEVARSLVVQTFKGSLAMLEQTGEHPAVLKAQVTSPGGTTIAGLRELEAAGIREALFAAVDMACRRSVELGSK